MSTPKVNCWEHTRCGREPGGARAAALGVCPAAVEVAADRVNGGCNAGRVCWAVSGTFCGSSAQGTFAEKQVSCMSCDFYLRVLHEEGRGLAMAPPALAGSGS